MDGEREEKMQFTDARTMPKALALSVAIDMASPRPRSVPRLEKGLSVTDRARGFRIYAHPFRAQI